MTDAGTTSGPKNNERLPLADYLARLAQVTGAPTSDDAGKVIWENGPYRVVLTDQGDGAFEVQYLTNRVWQYGIVTATIPQFLEGTAKEIAAFLNGPPAPLPPPKKYPVDEQRIQAIQRQLQRVQQQVYIMMDNRRWNLVYQDIVARNPALRKPNAMLAHFQRVYIDYAVLAVRRQAKQEDASVSLRGVMLAVQQNAAGLTREWYHRLWRGETKSRFAGIGMSGPFVARGADEIFSSFADATGDRVDPAIVDSDLAAFGNATDAIVHYADKIIAHDDKAGLGQKFDGYSWDLDGAVTAVANFTRRYSQLLFVHASRDMTPTSLVNPVAVFREPWLLSDDDVEAIGVQFDLQGAGSGAQGTLRA
jgi:hypothetical protein